MRWPVDNPRFGSPYGRRFHPTQHVWKLHAGQDFPNAPGTPLRAIAAGRVSANVPVSRNPGGGNYIQITLDNGAKARYFHMRSASPLRVGARVAEGQIVGYLGNTGTWTTGPHLHFEIKLGNATTDPRAYIQARLGTTAGKPNTATPSPNGEEEDEEMKPYPIYYKEGKTYYVGFVFATGLFLYYQSNDSDQNNEIAAEWKTGDFAKVTKSVYDAFKRQAGAHALGLTEDEYNKRIRK